MNAQQHSTIATTVARTVAPEDLRSGDFVSPLYEVAEFPSFFWAGDLLDETAEAVQIRFRSPLGGLPLKVKAICLPFVFTKRPDGGYLTFDTRECQLVRLDGDYARLAWKMLRKSCRPRKRRRRR